MREQNNCVPVHVQEGGEEHKAKLACIQPLLKLKKECSLIEDIGDSALRWSACLVTGNVVATCVWRWDAYARSPEI